MPRRVAGAKSLLSAAGCLLTAGLVTGCASPGPPLPPSLHLPEPAKALRAERVGDQVVLTFTASNNTTDGDALRGPLVAVLCRETPDPAQAAAMVGEPEKKPKAQPAKPAPGKTRKPAQPTPNVPVAAEPKKGPPCVPVQRLGVQRGANRIVETLPPALAAGPPALLGYRIELLNDRGRSDGPSEPVLTLAGAAPPPVGPLSLAPGREGIAVRWKPQPGPATVELSRSLLGAEPGSAADPARPDRRDDPLRASHAPVAPARKPGAATPHRDETVRLAATRTESAPETDPGGMVDASAGNGGTYRYVAQRVRTVEIAGRPLELRGEPSPAATIVFHDRFPPNAVTGVVSVPSFGDTPSIDLSWEPNSERDLAGYNVYRVESKAGGAAVKLNAAPLPGPAYRDRKAVPGTAYTYTVTAVDTLGNESKPSAPIEETLDKH